jgi:hypothetical protein
MGRYEFYNVYKLFKGMLDAYHKKEVILNSIFIAITELISNRSKRWLRLLAKEYFFENYNRTKAFPGHNGPLSVTQAFEINRQVLKYQLSEKVFSNVSAFLVRFPLCVVWYSFIKCVSMRIISFKNRLDF